MKKSHWLSNLNWLLKFSGRPRKVSLSKRRRQSVRSFPVVGCEVLENRQLLSAQPFTPGDVVVYHVGDAAAPSGTSAATDVWLDEYTPAGTLVQSIFVPNSTSGGTLALTDSGKAPSGGQITIGPDGHHLSLFGYDLSTGTANASTASTETTAAIVGENGIVQLEGFSNDSGANALSATYDSSNGQLYVSGSSGVAESSFTSGSLTKTTAASVTSAASGSVQVFNGQLYYSSAAGVFSVGTGEPTGTATATQLVGVGTGSVHTTSTTTYSAGSPVAFYFARLGTGAAYNGVDTLYLIDNKSSTGALLKYSYSGTSWVSEGAIVGPDTTAGAQLTGVTGSVSNGVATLYISAGNSATGATGDLYTFTDSTGSTGGLYNGTTGTTAGTLGSPIASTGSSATVSSTIYENFRGVASAPSATSLAISTATSASFVAGGATPVILSGGQATFADTLSSSQLNGSTLSVSITNNADNTHDILGITNQGTGAGQIGVNGTNLTYTYLTGNAMIIGTFTGGSNGNPLVITLNSNATAAAVQALMNQLNFTTTTNSAGVKTVQFTLTPSSGNGVAVSANESVTVSIESPTINPGTNITVTKNTGAHTVALGGINDGENDGNTNVSSVVATQTSGAISLFSVAPTVTNYNSSTGTATLSFTLAPNQSGSATITVTVTNSLGNTATAVFNLTVFEVAPTINPGSAITLGENHSAFTQALTGISDGFSTSGFGVKSVVATFTSTNSSLFAVGSTPVVTNYVQTAGTANLGFSLANNQTGTATITVTVTNTYGGIATAVFALTVNPITVSATGPSVVTGGTVTITSTALNSTESGVTAANIQYILTGTSTAGTLYKSGSALGLSGTFTQADINSGAVYYVSTGTTSTTDSFPFTISDLTNGGSLTGQSLSISVIAAKAFTPGDIVVYRLGDASDPAGSSATTNVWLDEYTRTGTLVQSIPLSQSTANGQLAVTDSGNSSTGGQFTLGPDGQNLAIFGYDQIAGTANATTSSTGTTVAVVGLNGIAKLEGFTNDAGASARSAAYDSVNNRLYTSGASGVAESGFTSGLTNATGGTITSSSAGTIEIFGGQVYYSSPVSGGIFAVGTGEPTGNATAVALTGVDSAATTVQTTSSNTTVYSAGSPVAFYMARLGSGVAFNGYDTLYVVDSNSGTGALVKYSYNGTTWVSEGAILGPDSTSGAQLLGLTGSVSKGVVTLFISAGNTSSGATGEVYKFTDSSGSTGTLYNGTAAGSLGSAIISTGSSATPTSSIFENFRGIAFVPAVTKSPVGTSNTVTTLENKSYTFSTSDFGFTDPNNTPPNSFSAVELTTLPTAGKIYDNGISLQSGQFVSVSDIKSGKLVFAPATYATGTGYSSLTFKVEDNGSTANGGSILDPNPKSMTINVTPVTQAPVGTPNTVTMLENKSYTFATVDFGFTDPHNTPPNTFTAVKITTLPTAGTLTDGGNAVTAGQSILVADLTVGKLVFAPATYANGANYASFTFQVQDNGSTANGGVNTDSNPESMTMSVTPVTQAPAGTATTVTGFENRAYTFGTGDFGFTDPHNNPPNVFSAVEITTVPTVGTLTDNGNAVTAGEFVAVADLTGSTLLFSPATYATGTSYANLTFQVQDNGSTTNGGVNTDPTPKSMTINVTPVTQAPTGASNTVTGFENKSYTFASADFGFSDPHNNPPNTLTAVKISSIPAVGTLSDNGNAVTLGQSIAVADITSGKLLLTPATYGIGTGYSSFTFQVQDNGSTANGGVNTDPSAKSMSINVTPVTQAPVGTSATVTTLENKPFTFAAANFGFADPHNSPANTFTAVEIKTLPTAGTLTDSGNAVTAGQFVPVSDLANGNLLFTPATYGTGNGYSSFTFLVQDNGSTANGGVNTSTTASTMAVNVTPVTQAPTGTSTTVTTLENKTYTFATANVGFTDPHNTPPNTFTAVEITTLPTVGTLTDGGSPVTAAEFVKVTDITSGKLTFAPVPYGTGNGYSNFTFQVQDNGSTANGGVNTAPTPSTMTVNVTVVTQPPVGTSNAITALENNAHTFAVSEFGFTDPHNTPANSFTAVEITTLPTAGTLTDGGKAVTAKQFVTVADVTSGKLIFTPATYGTGTGYASFTFQVQDNGSTVNGGLNVDQTPKTMTVNITPVTQAPTGTNGTVTALENNPYAFAASDFGFADPHNNPSNTLTAVEITTLPKVGTLTDSGNAVTAGQFVNLADVSGGNLDFTPVTYGTGTGYSSFTFQVRDNGSTANGGMNTSVTPNSLAINVTPVTQAPIGASSTVTTLENKPFTFGATNFGFTDPHNTPANSLTAVEITTVPTAGTLADNGTPVSAGQFVPVADLSSGTLVFTPAIYGAGTGYSNFTFQVQDGGSTANGGVNTDPSPKTVTIDVTPVTQAPVGTPTTVTMLENLVYTFAVSDFGFTDPHNTPANSLTAVEMTTVPVVGLLKDNGANVTAGQFVPVADIGNGKLNFAPAPNTSGSGYASFTFQVQDNGSTVNGGVNLDPVPESMTVNVTHVAQAPIGTSASVTMLENGSYTLTAGSFGFTDPHDTPANAFTAVEIATLPSAGSLTDKGANVTALQFVPVVDLNAGKLVYTPAANGLGLPYSSFTFQVQDNGSTANGGVNVDPSPKTETFNVVADKLVFQQAGPTTTVAGVTFPSAVIVAIEDVNNNVATTDNSVVTLTASGIFSNGSKTMSVQAVNGIATFSGLALISAGTNSIKVSDGTDISATSYTTVTPAIPSKIGFSGNYSGTAGSPISPVKVYVEDQYGNIVSTNDSSTVTISLNSGPGAFASGTLTEPVINGIATFSDLVLNTSGSYKFGATDSNTALSPAATTTVTISAAAPTQLVLTSPSVVGGLATVSAGTALKLAAEDQFGNIVSTVSSVTLTTTTGTFSNGSATATIATVTGTATFSNLLNLTGTYSFAASDAALSTSAYSITVTPAAASKLVFQQAPPATGIAGVAIGSSATVAVEDTYGNLATSNTTAVTLTVGTTTLTATPVNGIATFDLSNLIITKSGSNAITASQGTLTKATSTFVVSPAAASKVVFTQIPTTAIAGTLIVTAVKASVEDQFGNVVTTDGSTVTLSVATGPGTFTPGSILTATAVTGIATFSNLTLNTSGKYTFGAADGALTSGASGSVTVSAAAAKQMVVLQSPTTVTAGTAFTAVKVGVEDQFGNLVATANTVTLTLTSGKFSTGLATVSAATAAGVASLAPTINVAGTYTINVTDSVTGVTGTSFSVTVVATAANKLVFTQAPPTTGTAGVGVSPTVIVAVEDTYGNVVTTNSSTVTLTVGTSSFTATAVSGLATFSISNLVFNTSGTYTFTATDAALTKTTSSFVVSPAAASKLVVASAPTSGTAGVVLATALAVKIEDQFGNVVTTNNSTVTLNVATGPGSFAASSTLTATAVAGVASFSKLTLNTAGVYTFGVTDGTLTSAISGNVTIAAAAAARTVVQQSPTTVTAGTAFTSVKVAIEDQFGNIVATGGTVTLTLATGKFSTGLSTVSAATNAGIATFAPTINIAGTYAIAVVDSLLGNTNTSFSVTVTPGAASKLVFGNVPLTGTVKNGLDSTLTVIVEDVFGNTVTSDSSSVTLTIATGPIGGAFASGTLVTVNAVNGIAFFNILKLTKAGTYTLTATDGTLTSVTSTPIKIS